MSENHPAVSPQLQSEETQCRECRIGRMQAAACDIAWLCPEHGVQRLDVATLVARIATLEAEVARLREVLDAPAPEGETLVMSGPDGDGDYMATFSDYPTLSAFGSTPQLAIRELLIALRGAFDVEQDEVARLREALGKATNDDAMTDIVQEALSDLGVRTRLDTGESMRGFCNSVAGQIIDAMRAHFAAALATPAGEGRDDAS